MQHEAIPIGNAAPNEVHTIIEVPKGSFNKYKYLPSSDVYRFDRTLYSPVHYPADYGWVCGTKGQGRKPLNVLVMSTNPTFSGCLVVARPIGILLMDDDKGEDHKVLSVAVADPRFNGIKKLSDLAGHTLSEMRHFFEMYQALERGQVTIHGWGDVDEARRRIADAAGLTAPA